MRPGAGRLDRAGDVCRFAVAGWDRRPDVPSPGGVFWVEQGRVVGASNHDRNTVSNAPNAELGLHLAELTGARVSAQGSIGAEEEMYKWGQCDARREPRRRRPSHWAVLGQAMRRRHARRDALELQPGQYGRCERAARPPRRRRASQLPRPRPETIARKALGHFASGGYESQPPAFNAIFFRNLLLLHAATDDASLRTEIVEALRAYTDRAWSQRRDPRDRFHFSSGGVTLLEQSAVVQLLALLAWDPDEYQKLA